MSIDREINARKTNNEFIFHSFRGCLRRTSDRHQEVKKKDGTQPRADKRSGSREDKRRRDDNKIMFNLMMFAVIKFFPPPPPITSWYRIIISFTSFKRLHAVCIDREIRELCGGGLF